MQKCGRTPIPTRRSYHYRLRNYYRLRNRQRLERRIQTRSRYQFPRQRQRLATRLQLYLKGRTIRDAYGVELSDNGSGNYSISGQGNLEDLQVGEQAKATFIIDDSNQNAVIPQFTASTNKHQHFDGYNG